MPSYTSASSFSLQSIPHRLSFYLLLQCFYFSLSLSLRPSSILYTSPHSLSSPFCFYIRQFHIFFFSRHTANPSSFILCFRAHLGSSLLPSLSTPFWFSSPIYGHFFISFSLRLAPSFSLPTYPPIYLPRVSI